MDRIENDLHSQPRKIWVMSMTGKESRKSWGRVLLTGGHLALVALTAFDSASTPGGTWYRLIPIDPFCAIFMWVVTSYFGVLALFVILGSAQWYLIGLLFDVGIEFIRTRQQYVTASSHVNKTILPMQTLWRYWAFVVCLSLSGGSARADVYNWIGPSGGYWDSAANWTGGSGLFPGPGDTAQINPSLNGAINLDGSQSVGSLDFTNAGGSATGGTVQLNSGALTIGNPLSVESGQTLWRQCLDRCAGEHLQAGRLRGIYPSPATSSPPAARSAGSYATKRPGPLNVKGN